MRSGEAFTGLKHKAGNSKDIVEVLNRYFAPQANIQFEAKASKEWKEERWIPSFTPQVIDRFHFDSGSGIMIDGSADWTVFVVPHYTDDQHGDAVHRGAPGARQTSIWVPDNPTQPGAVTTPENFIVVLAHELSHGLGVGGESEHPKRNGVLGASIGKDQQGNDIRGGMLIDKSTLDKINPTKKK
jgi:hypothetical protein